jgi:hypothetical protein
MMPQPLPSKHLPIAHHSMLCSVLQLLQRNRLQTTNNAMLYHNPSLPLSQELLEENEVI